MKKKLGEGDEAVAGLGICLFQTKGEGKKVLRRGKGPGKGSNEGEKEGPGAIL